jgi:hypothetical protein
MTPSRATLLLLVLTAPASAAPAPLPREKRLAEAHPWSAPVDGLRVRLVAPQKRYRVGETIRLVLEIQNVSGSPITLVGPRLFPVITDKIRPGWGITAKEVGKDLYDATLTAGRPRGALRRLGAGATFRVEVAAGGELAERLRRGVKRDDESRLEGLYCRASEMPGVYEFRATYSCEPSARAGTWNGESLMSPPVLITLED